ncbi:S-layer homology domain-containing protein [Paenibacillus sp. FSL H7-0756]|uniref:S-layer homology domain-containing protein n=1 Tax=unclassified Paenibacillus TaxID=185978 RepID=UPI0030FC7F7B
MKKPSGRQGKKHALHLLLIVSLMAGLIPPGLWQAGQASAAAATEAGAPTDIVSSTEADATTPVVKTAVVNGTASAASDISGHWVEPQMSEWIGGGYIKGFQDGSFRPDQAISVFFRIGCVTEHDSAC